MKRGAEIIILKACVFVGAIKVPSASEEYLLIKGIINNNNKM